MTSRLSEARAERQAALMRTLIEPIPYDPDYEVVVLDGERVVVPRENEMQTRQHVSPTDAEILAVCRRIVNAQAEDEALWALNLDGTLPVSEAYLQQELRSLHAAVEGDLNAIAAIEDP